MKKVIALLFVFPLVVDGTQKIVSSDFQEAKITAERNEVVIGSCLDYLLKELKKLPNPSPKNVYEFLRKNQKTEEDQNIKELYYVLRSITKSLSSELGSNETLIQVTSAVNMLKFLSDNPEKQRFTIKFNQVTELLRHFIHLNSTQRSRVLSLSETIKNTLYQQELNNEIGPDDGADFYNSDLFSEKVKQAHNIQRQIDQLETRIKDFKENIEELTKEQLISRVNDANNLRNNLRSTKLSTEKGEKILISRNLRKHLMNVLQISIDAVMKELTQRAK
ncbi:MAG: hypothetical protein E7015_00185 [Alphaproteobacteria bacterium]|nr:hypothetical protein [Alphaproteobacteria bacterium]